MSEGVKIALIVGGVAVGAYVIVKVTAPTGAAPRNTAPSSTNTSFISGIISAAGSIGSFFSSSRPSAPANAPLANIDTYQQGYEDAYFGANASPDTASVQDTEAGFAIAQNPLQAIPLFGD